jgi:plastocyanin
MTSHLLYATALLAALGMTTAAAFADETITQKDKQFSQASVAIKQGDSVHFVNEDDVTHNIAIRQPDGSKKTSMIEKPGEQHVVKFDDKGDYEVNCLIHPKMKLKVSVQ